MEGVTRATGEGQPFVEDDHVIGGTSGEKGRRKGEVV